LTTREKKPKITIAPQPGKQELGMSLEADVIIYGGSAGCVDYDTEFLTPNGWVKFGEYHDGMEIAEYDVSTANLLFKKPEQYIKLPCEELSLISGKGLEMCLSDEHTVLYWHNLGYEPRTLPFSEVKDRHNKSKTKGWTGRIKTTFKTTSKGIDLSEGELRLQVAVMADGRVVKGGKNNYTQMRFAKERKYKRLLELCNKYNLPHKDNGSRYEERYSNKTGYEVIVYPKLPDKVFDEKYWQCSQEQLEIICDEVCKWDGSEVKRQSGTSFRYFSIHKKNCDFIQYAFAACGRNTSICTDTREGKLSYTVNANTLGQGFRSFANKDRKNEIIPYKTADGYKYCFTTSTGFFLARRNDKVFITGNSGKSRLLLMRPLRYIKDKNFHGVFFRKNTTQLTGAGGLWPEAKKLYSLLGSRAREDKLQQVFPSGSTLTFKYLEYDKDADSHQGLQYSFIGFDELTHYCLTADHDVLTTSGWKPITDIKDGESVYTMNDDKTLCVEQAQYREFDFDGELFEVNQRKGISFKATKNHRMVVERQDKEKSVGIKRLNEWGHDSVLRTVVNTQEDTILYHKFDTPRGRGVGRNANVVDGMASDVYAEFLGWYLSEGCAFYANKRKTSPKVSIRQTKEDNKQVIRDMLDKTGYKWSETPDGQFNIFSRQLFDILKPMGDTYQKRVPSWLFKQSKSVIDIFLRAFELGDGHTTATGAVSIGLANEGLVDDLQHLYFLTGRVSTKWAGVSESYLGRFNSFRLSVSKKNRNKTMVKNSDLKSVHHSGKVYCLVCEKNKNFYVRRNGRCFWSGNTEYQFTYLLSRLRSEADMDSFCMGTCNPDPDKICRFIQKWVSKIYLIQGNSLCKRQS